MTGFTTAQDLGVIDSEHWCKCICRMAVLAYVRRRHMLGILARCDSAVVATHTVTRDTRMVKRRGHPAGCRVAIVTAITAGNVCRVLAGGRSAVMAGEACTDYLRVIDCKHR